MNQTNKAIIPSEKLDRNRKTNSSQRSSSDKTFPKNITLNSDCWVIINVECFLSSWLRSHSLFFSKGCWYSLCIQQLLVMMDLYLYMDQSNTTHKRQYQGRYGGRALVSAFLGWLLVFLRHLSRLIHVNINLLTEYKIQNKPQPPHSECSFCTPHKRHAAACRNVSDVATQKRNMRQTSCFHFVDLSTGLRQFSAFLAVRTGNTAPQ